MLRWKEHLPRLLSAVKAAIPDGEVYIFGSLVRDELTAGSDIDVLIVSDKISTSNRHELALAIEDELKRPPIFELHLTDREKLDWYRRHAKEMVRAESLLAKRGRKAHPHT